MNTPAKDWRRAAEVLSTKGTARDPAPPALRLRQGTVTAASDADVVAGVCTITLGGDITTPIVGVACLSSYTPLVDDTVWVAVNGTDLMVLGRVGSDVASPFATAAGAVTVSVTSAVAGTASVSFPAGRFTVAPIVTVAPVGTTLWVAFASAITTSGFTATSRHIDNVSTSASPVVHWHAIQMTATSASG